MKVRSGFVSNSSSSSFLIAYTEDKCEHCGRSDLDIAELVRQSTNYAEDDRVEWDDPEEQLRLMAEGIAKREAELKELEGRDSDEVFKTYSWGGKQTVGGERESLNDEIRELQEDSEMISEALSGGQKVIRVSIGYHSGLNSAVQQMATVLKEGWGVEP